MKLAAGAEAMPEVDREGDLASRRGKERDGARPLAYAAGGLFAILPVAFVAWFVSQERTIYFWDYANYWVLLVELVERFRAGPLAALEGALRSVTRERYNDLACLPLLPAALLGTSRLAYATSVAILYGVPVMLLVAAVVRGLDGAGAAHGRRASTSASLLVVPLAVSALLPQLWFPVVEGSLDLVGCLPILAIFWLLAREPLSPSYGRALAIGVLLGLLPLLRRWYAFFTATFLVVYGAALLWAAWRERDGEGGFASALHARAALLAVLAAAGALVLLPLTGAVAERVFLRDHLFVQAPYRGTAGFFGAVERLWTYFGSITLAGAGAGLLLALRERATRAFAALFAVQAAAMLFAFNAVQTFGENHFYLLLPLFLVLESLALVRMLEAIRSSAARAACAGSVFALLLANFSAVLLPRELGRWVNRDAAAATALFGRVSYTPAVRTDLEEVARLARFVASVRPESRVYVLASSPTLNPDLLRNARLSLPERPNIPDLRTRISPGSHVDRRDGFPDALVAADVIVTSDPPQTHLAPSEQQVILVPLEEVRAGTTIGRGLRALPETFHLRDGVVARVWVRESPLAAEDRRTFEVRLAASHPEKPDLLLPHARAAASSALTPENPASRP